MSTIFYNSVFEKVIRLKKRQKWNNNIWFKIDRSIVNTLSMNADHIMCMLS